MFHISGAKNLLSDRGSRFPSGEAGADRGESPESTMKPAKAVGDKSTINSHSARSLPADLPADDQQVARIFAYGAYGPAFDADYMTDDIGDLDDYVSQAMHEVASMLSISAGKQVSVAMTVEKLGAEI
jgi:hypothetical protein